MDILFIPRVNRTAGDLEGHKLAGRKLQFFQQKGMEGLTGIVKRNGEVDQSEHVSSSCHLRAAGSVNAFSG